jgi:DNA helicase-2/ATP-dependent DNA helicase PcrA
LMSNKTIPLMAYREGLDVRHPEHGKGTIVSVSGRGPKRIARVRFDDGEHSFRLAFANLEVVE